ncbi:hypothetical protein Tco_0711742, partial [Tanacetum coccineum]
VVAGVGIYRCQQPTNPQTPPETPPIATCRTRKPPTSDGPNWETTYNGCCWSASATNIYTVYALCSAKITYLDHLGSVFQNEDWFLVVYQFGLSFRDPKEMGHAIHVKHNTTRTNVVLPAGITFFLPALTITLSLPVGTTYLPAGTFTLPIDLSLKTPEDGTTIILKPTPKATFINFESATRKSASNRGLQQDHHSYMNGFDEPLPSSHSLLG